MSCAEPWIGILTFDQLKENSSGRPLLLANLRDPEDRYRRCLTSPLLDAQVTKITEKGMHLVGYQIEIEKGVAIEFAQGWWAKFMPNATPQTPEAPFSSAIGAKRTLR